jgi:hypothetical protein
MSDFTDEALGRYLDQQSGMREALLHDPVQHAQIEALRQTLTLTERALADEGIPEDVRRRVVNRVVWGEPEGLVDVRAQFDAIRKQMLKMDLPPDLARAWWALDTTGPVRPDEEPT